MADPGDGSWHVLTVPGGWSTLESLGVTRDVPRALVLTELIRRLHFVNEARDDLERAAENLRRRVTRGGPPMDQPPVDLPLPLSPGVWNGVIFDRDVPASHLFVTILTDPAARLLYHGLMGLDRETRRWIESQPDLLDDLYGNAAALRVFSLFGSSIRIRGGQLVVPGGAVAATRWADVLDADPSRADRFVMRLLEREDGRLLGLYFTIASADPIRQSFLLGADDRAGAASFSRLASAFAACYRLELSEYPFTIRLNDPALLLMEMRVTNPGAPAGPTWRRFWRRAFEGDRLPERPERELEGLPRDGAIDAGWLASTVCEAPVGVRSLAFETLLFANRVFAGATEQALPDVLVAVRARRLYPALVIALEQAGIRSPATFARVARRAEQISAVGDARLAISALQQFQGAVTAVANAVRAQALPVPGGERLLESLAAIPLENDRYGGRLAAWFTGEWLTGDAPLEDQLVALLSGPPGPRETVEWEGLTYVVDLAADARRQLTQARRRQGGVQADTVAALVRLAAGLRAPSLTLDRIPAYTSQLAELRVRLGGFRPAQEFLDDVPDVEGTLEDAERALARITDPGRLSRARGVADDLVPLVDLLFGHVVASWAYAPHLGDSPAGDPSLRHEFGVRLSPRARGQRWEVAWRGDEDGRVSGALFGLDAALARRALRRLVTDALPPRPVLDRNEMAAMHLTAALSQPRHLTDAARDRIARTMALGAEAVTRAGRDRAALMAVSDAAAAGPWRTQALAWTAAHSQDPLEGWFSAAELAQIGGLRPGEVDPWGTALLGSGCLCVRMPRLRPAEAFTGRALSGVRAYLSPGLMFRIASALAQHRLPAALAPAVQRYAMRDLIDRVRPAHGGDLLAFARAIDRIEPSLIEDYIAATAAVGPLVRPESEADQ